jgi:hypothetical protein
MKFLRLNSIALAVVSTNAAVLPRQETTASPITSTPNTSATKKSYLTSITTLPMPTSVEGNTAYPPSTTAAEFTTTVQSSTYSTPSSQPPFTWYNNATATNVTASAANITTSSTSIFATGLSTSTANSTEGLNSTAITSSVKAPYANSTANGLVGGVAATGTAVVVTGLSATNATSTPVSSSGNSTGPAPVASTSMLVQLYLSKPSTAIVKDKTSATGIPLGSNMTLIVDEDDDYSSDASQATATVALFSNSTNTAGVAQASGGSLSTVPLSTASVTAGPKNNGTLSAAAARSTSTVHFSNTTMVTVTVKPNPTGNSTLPAASGKAHANATSSSTGPLSTSSSNSSRPVANAIANNGTMFAITYDNKNGTIIQLVEASNATNSLAATGTAASTASASADLDRRNMPEETAAPITPASAAKGSWSKFAYAQTEYLPRPSRFFNGEGWSLGRRSRA